MPESQTVHDAMRALSAVSAAARQQYSVAKRGSPCEALPMETVLKLLRHLERARDLTARDIPVVLEAAKLHHLEVQLSPVALSKFMDAIIHAAPRMTARQVAHSARSFSDMNRPFSSEAGVALMSVIVRTLPQMAADDVLASSVSIKC
jgi:5-enolpyruvylshikimate-3-phosphate synthase